METPGSLTLWDIAPDGRLLLTRDKERRAIVGVPPAKRLNANCRGSTTRRCLISLWMAAGSCSAIASACPSADRWITAIHLGRTTHSPTISLPMVRLSLYRLILSSAPGSVPTELALQLPLPAHGIVLYSGAYWFPDGRRILFNGRESGHDLRSYIQDIDGGPPRPLTPESTRALSISPDGEWAAAIGPGQAILLWPVSGGASHRCRARSRATGQ